MKSTKLNKWSGIGLTVVAIIIAAYVTFLQSEKNGLELQGSGVGYSGDSGSLPVPEDMKSLTDLYRVINLVQRRYIDASRISPKSMFVGAMRAIQLSIAPAMVFEEHDMLTLKMGKASQKFALKDIDSPWILLQQIKDAFSFIKKESLDELDLKELEHEAINGMLRTLDPHSVFLNSDQYREMQDKTQGKFAGLGIVISIKDGALTIVSPIDGTPADRAGLTAGDQIIKIDEESTVNMPLSDAVDLLRGEPGTWVSVYIMRKGWTEPKLFKIVRAEVKVESLQTHLLPSKVGYIRIKDFQGNTAADILNIITEWKQKNIKGLVLDLRGCPGGLLEASIEVSDLFLTKGIIVTTAGQDPNEREVRRASDLGIEPEYPIVAIVDQGSASASEILAGALKNHGRAIIIGDRTFGKGSVQVLFEFQSDTVPNSSTALKLTTAQYLTPGDMSIQSVGVVPHVEITPMRADIEMIDLEAGGGYRESDLKHHFETQDSNVRDDEPYTGLRYLWTPPKSQETNPSEGGDNEEEGFIPEPTDVDKNKPFEPDFVASLAKDMVLALAPSTNPASTKNTDALSALVSLSGLLSNRRIKEEKHLIAALKKLDIDWQGAHNSLSKTEANVSISIDKDNVVKAGEESYVSMTVTNSGPSAFYRLWAVSQSDFRPLDDREILFGKVGIGETVTRRFAFRVPKDSLSEINDVKWTFKSEGALAPDPVALRFKVVPLSRPHFGFKWRIDDKETGNGDGIVQIGESVKLIADIHNLGEGLSLNTYATLKNLSGKQIFLTRGREVLETVESKVQKEAVFAFEVKTDFSQKEATFELAIADIDLREYLVKKLSIPIHAQGAIQPDGNKGNGNDTTTIKAAPIVKINEVQSVTKSETVTIHGVVTDQTQVRNIYIFVDNDKRFFASNTNKENPKQMDFKAELPLKHGINYITVVAEKDSDIKTRRMIAVRRDRQQDGMPYILSRSMNEESVPLEVLPTNLDSFSLNDENKVVLSADAH